jgi:hypothetical protein
LKYASVCILVPGLQYRLEHTMFKRALYVIAVAINF